MKKRITKVYFITLKPSVKISVAIIIVPRAEIASLDEIFAICMI